jgi:hypothetical protein
MKKIMLMYDKNEDIGIGTPVLFIYNPIHDIGVSLPHFSILNDKDNSPLCIARKHNENVFAIILPEGAVRSEFNPSASFVDLRDSNPLQSVEYIKHVSLFIKRTYPDVKNVIDITQLIVHVSDQLYQSTTENAVVFMSEIATKIPLTYMKMSNTLHINSSDDISIVKEP